MAEQTTAWLSKFQRSPFVLTLAALAGLVVGIASATEAVDKIAIWVGLKPNALQLARDDERARFSRELTRAAWHRLFSMRRYVLAAKGGYAEEDREKEWSVYSTVLGEWNRDLMVNILSLEQHYGSAKRDEFEQSIQREFGRLHYCIEGLRRPASDLRCELSATRDIAVIEHGLDLLNRQLYGFVSGLPHKDARW